MKSRTLIFTAICAIVVSVTASVILLVLVIGAEMVVVNKDKTINKESTEIKSTKVEQPIKSTVTFYCDCSTQYEGFCMIPGHCYNVPEENIVACKRLSLYGGKRCVVRNTHGITEIKSSFIGSRTSIQSSCLNDISLVIIDRFWNSSAIQTTLLQLPTKNVDETSKESKCLSYDTLSINQLIVALVIVKIITGIGIVLHLRY